jgi:predicted enzyme related to lactoylglutathione lyase
MQPPEPPVGAIVWTDLTVPDAAEVRDFYTDVAGWRAHEQPMAGGYTDFIMSLPDGEPVGGICYRRGPNAAVPAAWLPYVRVADLDEALGRVRARGGRVIDGPRTGFAVVADPAGAHVALFDPQHPTAVEQEGS